MTSSSPVTGGMIAVIIIPWLDGRHTAASRSLKVIAGRPGGLPSGPGAVGHENDDAAVKRRVRRGRRGRELVQVAGSGY
jgi:hypothetical protein